MKTVKLVSVGLLTVLAALSFAQGANLKRVAKVGDVTKFKIKADIEIQGMQAAFTSTMIEKVLKIEDNGNIHTESSQTDTKIKIGADEMDAGNDGGGAQTTISTPWGEVIELKGDMVDANAYRVANMNAIRVPDKVLNVGDTWENITKADKKLGTVSATAKFKVEKAEKIGSFDTLCISYDFKESEGSEPAGSTGKVWINTADGSMVKLVGEWKNAPLPGAPGPISAKVTIDRI